MMMTQYTINSELGPMDIQADSIEAAKEIYEREMHYDFDGAAAGEYPGSWFFVNEDGVRVEDHTAEMPA
jgi:hypothetical protein